MRVAQDARPADAAPVQPRNDHIRPRRCRCSCRDRKSLHTRREAFFTRHLLAADVRPQSPGDDAGLKSFAPQYLAISHLWLAFHAHQARQDGAGDATHTEARQALRILRQALDANIPPSPSAPKRSPVNTKVPSPKEKAAVKRRPVAPPTAVKSAFKTPQVSRTLTGAPSLPWLHGIRS